MESKKANKKNDDAESIILNIMNERKYEINLLGCDAHDYSKKTISSVLWADEWGHNVIYKLFLIFQGELNFITTLKRFKDLSSFAFKFLYKEFYNDIRKKKKLKIEEALENKISDLGEYQFLTSKGFGKNYKTVADEYEEITINEVKDMILSLRNRRISVYKAILNEYRKNKEKYLDYLEKSK